ncbi:BMP family ABC transporter substrate-binding protein [Aquibium sp. A9E412]|uniref:BMP family ABC transporter substrate-binding protein n=1 Tax=Aquibium sp. A9E412 TaxID=2976767 RepID=UPI0025B13CAE|nr:BMP family ABC transporter substrate-binding protein [Aquibium sp. A9E412]MDN2566667.1 BMP family ABC transporter substrate-binding protein [Aquibium sp. A9E412]
MKTIASLAAAVGLGLAGLTAAQAQEDRLFVYVSPDPIGVNAFLKLGQVGTEAAGERFGAEVKTFESSTAAARMENVNAAINEGADVVVLLGFEFNDIVAQLAPTAPDIDFLIVDQCIENRPDNVHCAVFREYEASYLIGVAAGMLTQKDRVGVVGALDIPFLHRYTDGYAQGAKASNEGVEVDIRWVGGENPFSDPVRAKEQAVAMHGAGADVIFTATAGGDFGVFEAAQENDFKAFTVDVNWCPEAPEHLVDSTLKRVDTAIVTAMEAILAGENQLFMSLGLKEGGMSTVALEEDMLADSQCLIAEYPEIVEAMREAAGRIKDGSLELEDPMFAQN